MSTATPTGLVTIEQFFEMEFDESVELICGRVVPKYRWRDWYSSPAIGSVLARMVAALSEWADAGSHGVVAVGVELDTPAVGANSTVKMEIAFYPTSVLSEGKFRTEVPLEVPSLGALVLDPDDCFAGVMDRIRALLSAGVKEVWLVDYSSHFISVSRPHRDDMGLWDGDSSVKSAFLPGFEHPLKNFFSKIQRPAPEPRLHA